MSTGTFKMNVCAYHWERLERLADHFGHEDKEAYAANLLMRAIEESEMWMRSELYSHYERIIEELEEEQRRFRAKYRGEPSPKGREPDDDIPF